MSDDLLTIGELAIRTGVRTSALRFYDEAGVVSPAGRESGQRRYDTSAVAVVGVVRMLQEVGFTLAEIRRLLRDRSAARAWEGLARQKLDELDAQIEKATAARTAIEHSLACPHDNILECPNFWATVEGVLANKSLAAAHRDEPQVR